MADELKTKPATLRLTPEVVEALERFRTDKERELRALIPSYELSQSAALQAAVVGHLQSLGYLKREGEASTGDGFTERRKVPRPAPDTIIKSKQSDRNERLIADYRSGKYPSQSKLAQAYGIDQSQVSRMLKKAGVK